MNAPSRRLGVASLVTAVAVATALVAASAAVPAPGDSANLGLTKSDSPDPVTVGSVLTYTIEVTNAGPQGATGTTVTDRLPASLDFISASASQGTCARNGRNVTCTIGALPTSGSETVTIRVRPTRDGNVTNTASVESVENDPVAANNEESETTRVNPAPQPPAAAACRGVTATIKGTGGSDQLTGTGGRDVIAAFGGNDTIAALAGTDLVCAGAGDDYVGGGGAADRVFGGIGADRLVGRGGPDLLAGNRGRDVLKGNRGSDRLRGGRGFDRCRGGAGLDFLRSCEG